MKETTHDYQNCIAGNFYNGDCNGAFESWEEFKEEHSAFTSTGFDDTYHYVFRYDIHKKSKGVYTLELCIMLQRKGIYTNLLIKNISQELLDTEIKDWLKERADYVKHLWGEVL